jgi:ubiquinone biosynthesis protein
MGGTVNDLPLQMAALRDLGALPADVDVQALIVELGLDRPPVDPTTMDPDELMAQLRELTKSLLGYGARMPKELMLFVKNMLFCSSVIGTMAPDVDLFAEVAHISMYFATKHGDRIAADVGIDPREHEIDLSGMKASMGITDDRERITMRELEERRRVIRERMQSRRRKPA